MPPHSRSRTDDLAALVLARRARLRRIQPARRRASLVLTLIVAAVLVAVVAGGAITANVVAGSCTLNTLRPLALGSNSFVFANDGSFLGVVPSKTNRQPLRLDQISPWLPKATVAIEDRRFWQHGALDYQAIARALVRDVSAGRIVEGGSTITQELVRNLYIGNQQRTLSRKLKEACLAVRLAQQWSKSQILAAYLNDVFYGRHAYGAQAGAETFFSRNARHLTLTQAALLAGLPQAPSVYNPVVHPAAAMQRRNEVLLAMFRDQTISEQQYARAVASPLDLKLGSMYTQQIQPNFFGWAQQQLVERYDARGVEAGGLQVRTTLDPRMQYDAEAAVRSVLRVKTDPATAVVAIDPATGAVRAMVGYVPDGRKLKFNLATQSTRTAGSSFKPFVLATAAKQGVSFYSSFSGPSELIIPDRECYGINGPWDVHNYADEHAGYMNLLDATANSVNTIFAQLVVAVGPKNVVTTAHQMGITTGLQPVCSITLGTQPVNPLEMTDGYATLAAGGIHHAPQAFEWVRSPTGKLVERLTTKGNRVLSPNEANLVTYALEGVVQHGTGTAASLGNRPAAGKTGTAESFQDAWFCGYVPQLATCVWVGYPKGEIPLYGVEGFGQVFGGSLPAEIWHRFMSAAVAKMPVRGFAYPNFVGHYISGQYYAPQPAVTTTPSVINVPTTPITGPPPAGH